MLIIGTTKRILYCGHATHKLDPEMVVCGLISQLIKEFGVSWYACVMLSNGQATMRGLAEDTPAPDEPMRAMMLGVSAMLNRDAHHNGCWIVIWHLDRMCLMWRDGDGDAPFIMQVDEPWARIRQWSVLEFCDRAETAFDTFRQMLLKVDLKPEHTIKQAQGQKPVLH